MGAIKNQPEHHLLSDREVFVSAHLPRSGSGRSTKFRHDSLTSELIRQWIEETRVKFSCSVNELEFKLVGGTVAVDKAESLFRELKILIKSAARRTPSKLEVIFYPEEGRVRVGAALEVSPARPTEPSRKSRVLIVDDSPTIRKLLTRVLSADPGLEVVGEAERPSQVEALIRELKPDVITLDIHMPEMDGVQCLKKYLPNYPVPTVIISSISKEEGPLVLAALEAGAIDYIQKPNLDQLAATAPAIVEKVKTAARARIQQRARVLTADPSRRIGKIRTDKVLVFGSSTGGTEALASILVRLPADIPPIVCVQHIPAVFSLAFAKRLDSLCPFEVKEAEDGDVVRRGLVLIAPGGFQMSLVRKNGELTVRIDDSPPVNRHKPSVDVLYRSAAKELGAEAYGIILTGMGADGADGMLEMRKAGARTIAQDEATSVVFGMPREAILRGGAESTVALPEIPDVLAEWLAPKVKAV